MSGENDPDIKAIRRALIAEVVGALVIIGIAGAIAWALATGGEL